MIARVMVAELTKRSTTKNANIFRIILCYIALEFSLSLVSLN